MQTRAVKGTSPFGFTAKRLLGQILLDGKFISKKTLDRAISLQKETNEQLGKILVDMGAIDDIELKAALSIQDHLTKPGEIFKIVAGARQRLGELLTQAGRITKKQLEFALTEQKRTGEKIGEILLRLEFLTGKDLNTALRFQKQQETLRHVSTPLRLGELLVTMGEITREQLEKALKNQKLSGKKIGEVLVESGYLQPEQISRGLKLQQMLLTAVLVACLSLISSPNGNTVHAESSSTELMVTAHVIAQSRLKVLFQVPEITITNADIQRGYVDLKTASRIEIRCNSRAGYLLNFEGLSSPFKQIEIHGLANDVLITSGSSFVHQPYVRGPITIELSYRFVLSDDAEPGTYVWPLTLSTQPV